MKTSDSGKAFRRFRPFRLLFVCLCILLAGAAIAWQAGLVPSGPTSARDNAIMVIAPYRHDGTWVFDDESAGLVREPFVAGVPEMIDVLVDDIPNADSGFRLLFSANPFPGHQKKLTWLRGDSGGNYYELDEPLMEGWICPAMFKYFSQAPEYLYVKAESKVTTLTTLCGYFGSSGSPRTLGVIMRIT